MSNQIPQLICTYQASAKQKIHIVRLRHTSEKLAKDAWVYLRPFDVLQNSLFGTSLARPMAKLCDPVNEVPLKFVKDRQPHEITCRTCLSLACDPWMLPTYPGTEPDDLLVLADLAEEHGLPHMALNLRWCHNAIRGGKKTNDELPSLQSMLGIAK